MTKGEVAPVRASVSTRVAFVVGEKRSGLSRTVYSRDLPDLEGKIALDLMVALKERHQQKFALKMNLKALNGAPVRKRVL